MYKRLITFLIILHLAFFALGQVNNADELYQNGLQFKKTGLFMEAIDAFKKAVEIKPDFTDALYELGWCYNELNQFSKALPVLQKAVKLKPDDSRIVYETGFAKAHAGLPNEALDDYNKAITLNPDFSRAYAARADLYREVKENTKLALIDYLKVLELDTSGMKIYYWVGWCYNDLGKYELAIPYLKKAITFEKQNYLSYSEIGFSFYSLAKYNEAIQYLLKADELKPKFETTLYYLGMCYVKTGKKADAVKKYNELVAAGSEYGINLLNEIKNMK